MLVSLSFVFLASEFQLSVFEMTEIKKYISNLMTRFACQITEKPDRDGVNRSATYEPSVPKASVQAGQEHNATV